MSASHSPSSRSWLHVPKKSSCSRPFVSSVASRRTFRRRFPISTTRASRISEDSQNMSQRVARASTSSVRYKSAYFIAVFRVDSIFTMNETKTRPLPANITRNVKLVDGGHLLWQGSLTDTGHPTTVLYGYKYIRPARIVYEVTHPEATILKEHRFRNFCGVRACVAHSVPVRPGIRPVSEMDENETKIISEQLNRNSQQSESCRLWTAQITSSGYGACSFMGHNWVMIVFGQY